MASEFLEALVELAAAVREVVQHPAVPVVTFGLGFLLGHRLQLYRDKRNDFNRAAEAVRPGLLREVAEPNIHVERVGAADLDLLRQRLQWCQRRRFDRALRDYEQARQDTVQDSSFGQVRLADPDAVRAAARRLMAFTMQR